MQDLIKLVVKLSLLYRHQQFNPEEQSMTDAMHAPDNVKHTPIGVSQSLRSKFKMMVLTMISYHDVAFTYDPVFLTARFIECKARHVFEPHAMTSSPRRIWCRSSLPGI